MGVDRPGKPLDLCQPPSFISKTESWLRPTPQFPSKESRRAGGTNVGSLSQAGISVSADYFITTADDITGPWESSVNFYTGETGTFALGAYTLQAHPGLNPGGSTATNEIYISHTKNDAYAGTSLYSTPLIHIVWN